MIKKSLNQITSFFQVFRTSLSGSGGIYVILILGLVSGLSFLLTGGLVPQIEKNPVNPEFVEILVDLTPVAQSNLQMRNILAVPSPTPGSGQNTPTPGNGTPILTPTITKEQCFAQTAVAIVVDTSGSMSERDPGQTKTRIGRLQDALRAFVSNFSPDAALSLIEFADGGRVLVPFGKLSQISGSLNTAIDNLADDSNGATNMRAGLEDAIGQLDFARTAYPNYKEVTVFMSDGLPESGDCKYRQYSGNDGYNEGPYNWYASGDPNSSGIVPPFCILPETGQQPTFFTHKWSPIEPGRVIKQTGELFSISMRQTPDLSDSDYTYEKDKYDKTGSLMLNLASDPSSKYYVSIPTTANLTTTYQNIAQSVCP